LLNLIRKIQLLWVLKILNISTYSLEQNLDFFRKLKENYPTKVIIASIMGSNEDEWTKLASLCEKAGADGLAAINTIKAL
jgi:dihydrodipicolinate synthase/N-acetylneuraminate lyase